MLLSPRSAVLTISLAISTFAFGQNDTRPHKVLTPEQRAYQQSWNAWFKDHQIQQARAKQIYEAEIAQEKAGDCPAANSTREFIDCYDKVLITAESSLKDFESTLLALMAGPPALAGESEANQAGGNASGPAGPILSPSQLSVEFDQLEKVWRGYRDAACTAAFHQFGGGTVARRSSPNAKSDSRVTISANWI